MRMTSIAMTTALAASTAAAQTADLAGTYRCVQACRGGLFDYRVFGPGTVIDAPMADDDAPHLARNVTFGRLVLARPLPHPLIGSRDPIERAAQLVSGDVLRELAVLPPDLRPLQRLDDDRWQSSSLNDLYRRVIQRNERLAKLVEANTEPAQIVAEELALHDALLALFDNEHQATPVLDALGQPLGSLRWLAGDLETGLRAFAADAGTARARKIEAVAFAMGVTLART